MIFNNSYYTAMDRGYYMPLAPGQGMPGESPEKIPEIGVSPADIGVSAHPGQDQLQQIKARIFQGASRVELGFFGRGKGSMQGGQTTPEMYGTWERIDMRELAKINKIQLTTHATTAAGSLAGMGQQGFDEFAREQSLHEIQKAIDFAADVTNGGAIVVHANEFQRPILDNFGKENFKGFKEEDTRAVRYLVDRRTGQMHPVRKNEVFYEPSFRDYPGDSSCWLGVQGQKISKTTTDTSLLFERVPDFQLDPKTGVPIFTPHRVTWSEIEKRAEQRQQAGQNVTPEKLFYQIQIENQIAQARGSSLFFGRTYKQEEERRDKYKDAFEFYQRIDNSLPESEKWKIMHQKRFDYEGVLPTEPQNMKDYFLEKLNESNNNLRQMHESSAAADVQAAMSQETLDNMLPIKDYALGKTADTVSRAAIFAWDREKHLRADVREGDKMEKPLFIAVENYFPEVYGGHPDEIKEIVKKSRAAMVDEIMKSPDKYNVSDREDAAKIAADHIKATWDTGHAFIWKKYFQGSDAEFKNWYMKKAKEWKDEGIMGHVHITDNFGYDDEHLVPGQGIVPIKDFVNLMRDKIDKGEVDLIVEPNHKDHLALLGGWRTFGSSIYGTAFGRQESWVEVERSYFGRTAPPYFLYGETAPDPESWVFWSGQRME